MAGVEISQDGRTATVNGQLVALETLPSAQQDQIRAMARDPMNPQDGGRPVVSGFGGVPSQSVDNSVAPQWAVPPSAPTPATPMVSRPMNVQATPTARAPSMPASRRVAGPRFATLTNRSTQTQGIVGAEKHLEAQAELAKRERDLAQEQAGYRVESAEARAQAAGAEVKARESALADVERSRQDGMAEASRHMESAEAKRAEASALQEKGHDFWEDKSVPQRMMAIIGLAAGGALAGMNGGPNQAMAQLNRMMAKEDELHQRKINGLRKDAEGEISFYNIAKSATDDEVAQRLMVQNMQLDAMKARTAETQAGLDADTGASVALGELTLSIDQRQAANAQALAERFSTTAKTRTVPIKPAAPAGAELGPDGKPVKSIPGTVITDAQAYAGLSAEERKLARKLTGNASSLYDVLGRMAEIRRSVGTEAFDSASATEYANMQQSAKVSLSQMLDQGTITSSDAEQMKDLWEEDLSPKLSDLGRVVGNDATLNKIESARKNVEMQANGRLKASGLRLEGLAAPSKRIKGAGSW